MPDDELEELAADIKANGLQQPLIVHELDGEPLLIDGRNRREACRRIGVIPDYVLLDGQDPVTYILSANINRRHMTKGQRAMAVARICFETKQSVRDGAKQSGTSVGRLAYATAVINHAPDLADQVINGSISLDNAYEEALLRKGRADTHESRFNALKADAPDLGELVVEGQLTLEEAQIVLNERKANAHREKLGLARCLHELALHVDLLESDARRARGIHLSSLFEYLFYVSAAGQRH